MRALQNRLVGLVVLVASALPLYGATAADFGVKGNVPEDQTAAIQKYLDDVAAQGGGAARLPAGQFTIRGSLTVPTGVTLIGAWEQPHHGILTKGTVLMAYAGRGQENGPAVVELTESSGVKGITICYPEQTISDVQPYPWAIHGKGMHCTVEDVTLVNAYQGVAMGPEHNELHVIRNVFGCVLRRGVYIDNTTDIGRIENVHFNPHYWARSGHEGAKGDATMNVAGYMQQNLEAFIFGRTDWQSVRDCFVFGARIGYYFIAGKNGACNGQLSGIGADACQYCVYVDAAQPPGLLISNGQFVCLRLQDKAEPRIGIVTSPKFDGVLQLTNCSFWGDFTSFAKIEGAGLFTMAQVRTDNARGPAVEILSGRAVIRDVIFNRCREAHVVIGKDVRKAVVESNFAERGVKITNNAGERLTARDNEQP